MHYLCTIGLQPLRKVKTLSFSFLCSVQFDYIIVGQGLCGTLLSWHLIRAGKRVLVIDDGRPFSAGKVASGLINPVTGMRVVKSWMFDEFLHTAKGTYSKLEAELGIKILRPCNVLEFHATAGERDVYTERATQSENLREYESEAAMQRYFNFYYGISEIRPCYMMDLQSLQETWRRALVRTGALLEEQFDWQYFKIAGDGVAYKDIIASKLICCEGSTGMENPFFTLLPFSLNKGEAIVLDIPDLPADHVYKHTLKITPWRDGLFWAGSSFDWKFEDPNPSDAYRQKVIHQLNGWLKLPYKIVDHIAAIRPSTVGQKPFVGFHPHHPNIGILNGMGTKGCSQAPFFANDMAGHLLHGKPLFAEASVERFKRVLGR